MSEMFEMPALQVSLPDERLPLPDEITYYVLEKERKVFLQGDIGEDTMALERLILRWNMEDRDIPVKDRRPIRIYIMCYGGELDFMWSIVDTIRLSKTPVYTINMGVAGSAAALIFIAGEKRWMMPNAKVIIHEGSAQMAGDAVKVLDATDSYRRELQRMKDFILEHTDIPKRMLNKKRNNDWTLDCAYCLETGVAHSAVTDLDSIL